MPSDRTTVTELGTALGMLGTPDIDVAVRSRTPVMHSLSPEDWDRLAQLRAGGAFDTEFHAAWENGRAFLAAEDGLRGRLPNVVEWKGTGRAPGDEVAPIDLRVDHVYLVSCKYLSDILFNASPPTCSTISSSGAPRQPIRPREAAGRRLVRRGGAGGVRGALRRGPPGGARLGPHRARVGRGEDPSALHRCPERRAAWCRCRASTAMAPSTGGGAVRRDAGRPPAVLRSLPTQAAQLSAEQREALGAWLRPGWPGFTKALYARLSEAVASASVRRWERAMEERGGNGEAILWRLLRMGGAPYFVLGSSATRSLRLRIATAWDWRQQFQLLSITMEPQQGGNPGSRGRRWCGTG